MIGLEFFSTILFIAFVVIFIWFALDTFLITRYGGNLNRGITVWYRPLSDDERIFLSGLKHDIVQVNERGLWIKRNLKSFIAISDGEALIRYTNPAIGTSWPVVFYVNLQSSESELEYRMSLPGLLLWLTVLSIPIYSIFSAGNISVSIFVLLFFVLMLAGSLIVEIAGAEQFLFNHCDQAKLNQSPARELGARS
jgi:hypothetical protein